MGKGSGTTRGDRLRELLPRDGAVIGIDLAEDKQALAVVGWPGRFGRVRGRAA
jgi:hypothetical protein